MNKYDSERIVGLLQHADYELTEDVRQANLVILNTCSIREKADQKFYSELGRLKRIKQLPQYAHWGVWLHSTARPRRKF